MIAAAIDTGSNTVLMIVGSHAGGGGVIEVLDDRMEFTRLGKGVDQSGRLDPDSRAQTLSVFRSYAARAQELGASVIAAAGTSALRDASDAPEFIEQIQQDTGIAIEVIAGEREAALSFSAVQRTTELSGDMLVVDVGGNSTEFVSRARAGSLNVGAVRMTERFLPSDPPTRAEISALDAHLDEQLATLEGGADHVVAVAGTATTLAAIEHNLAVYDSETVHGTKLSKAHFTALLDRFLGVTTEERKKIAGLHEKRADVIIAGHRILSAALRRYNLDTLTVADRGVRHALLIEALHITADRVIFRV